MPTIELSLALSRNAMTQPLIEGKVKAEGIRFIPTALHPSELFWRQLKFSEFDVSEMSLSSYMIMIANHHKEWTALPIFTTRRFFHSQILVHCDSGVEKPEDLVGKRVGVPEYQQTAALWARAALMHEFGVYPEDLNWFMERSVELSHGGVTGFRPHPNLRFQYIAPEKNIGSMLVAGELDASLVYIVDNNLVDRSRTEYRNHASVRPLFRDPVAESVRYYRKTAIYPLNHCVVVRSSLLERYPWIALNVYNAFQQAKMMQHAQVGDYLNLNISLGHIDPDKRSDFGMDPLPYGIQANFCALEKLPEYSYEQGLTPRVVSLDEMFAKSTLDL